MRNLIIAFILFSVALEGACQRPGAVSWKGFSAPSLSGASFVISGRESSPVLLAFLALGGVGSQPQSRAAAVVLTSLDHQYRGRGLRVVAIDASALTSHQISTRDEVVNRTADWGLPFSVLEDSDGSRAKAFQIRTLPTTVLISASGQEIGRWDGYPRTPVLARAIECVIGGPLGTLPDSAMYPDRIPAFSAK